MATLTHRTAAAEQILNRAKRHFAMGETTPGDHMTAVVPQRVDGVNGLAAVAKSRSRAETPETHALRLGRAEEKIKRKVANDKADPGGILSRGGADIARLPDRRPTWPRLRCRWLFSRRSRGDCIRRRVGASWPVLTTTWPVVAGGTLSQPPPTLAFGASCVCSQVFSRSEKTKTPLEVGLGVSDFITISWLRL